MVGILLKYIIIILAMAYEKGKDTCYMLLNFNRNVI